MLAATRTENAGALPRGTVTFLLTDIEGSTRLWDEHAAEMGAIMARHDALIEAATIEAGGTLVRPRGEGDSRFAVFAQATAAVRAATRMQLALSQEAWGLPASTTHGGSLRVRIALHTGEADVRDGDYYGSAVNRCARLRNLAQGGQVFLSGATAALVRGQLPEGAMLRDLGDHQLRGLAEPERVFQLVHPNLPDDFPPLRSVGASHWLPHQPTPFVQRSAELRHLDAVLRKPDVRLLTLIGSGGIGKTRLAIALADRLAAVFADGVWFVDLSSVRDPTLVFASVAHALEIDVAGRRSSLEHVRDSLRTSHALLVLDNFEQVITAAPDVGRLLADCSDVKVVATSREPLRLRWEHIAPVPPLELPPSVEIRVEELSAVPAVAFFVQRAQASDPEFRLSDQNAHAVGELCARLDGLPLALELGAAQMRLLSPAALLTLYAEQVDVLRGSADAPDRHQSLRAAVEWSHNLLTPEEQRLFRQVSVFDDGCDVEAVRFVCQQLDAGGPDAFVHLLRLVDKGLLRHERTVDGAERWRLLETVRVIAAEKLQLAGPDETNSIRQRHAEYFLALARTAEYECWGPQPGIWLDRADREYANFRSALSWLTSSGQTAMARALVVALEPLWTMRGHVMDGRKWLQVVTSIDAVTPDAEFQLGTALALLGLIEQMLGAPAESKECARRSLAEARRAGDRNQLARSLWLIGELARAQGDQTWARASLEEALGLSQALGSGTLQGILLGLNARIALESGSRREARALAQQSVALLEAAHSTRFLGRTYALLGSIAMNEGDAAAARLLFEKSVATCRAVGDRWTLLGSLTHLASLLVTQRDFGRARALLVECAQLGRGQRDAINATRCLIAFAQLAAAHRQYARTMRLLGAVDALRTVAGLGLSESYGRSLEQWLAPARSTLGQTAAEIWREGQALTFEEAFAYALGEDEPLASSDVLSPREWEVTTMLARGYSNQRIAQELVISQRTVEAHVAHIMAKLGLESRLQIAAWAADHDTLMRENTDVGARPRR